MNWAYRDLMNILKWYYTIQSVEWMGNCNMGSDLFIRICIDMNIKRNNSIKCICVSNDCFCTYFIDNILYINMPEWQHTDWEKREREKKWTMNAKWWQASSTVKNALILFSPILSSNPKSKVKCILPACKCVVCVMDFHLAYLTREWLDTITTFACTSDKMIVLCCVCLLIFFVAALIYSVVKFLSVFPLSQFFCGSDASSIHFLFLL